jgi:osmoprotectant transport system permease protein
MSRPTNRRRTWVASVLLFAIVVGAALLFWPRAQRRLRVGSKAFTEGVILGEVLHLLVESEGVPCEHVAAMGGTRIVFDALVAGEIDAYVEYTGTLQRDILATGGRRSLAQIREALEAQGVRMGPTLGFDNTCDLGMRRETAEKLGVTSISDLREHPQLQFGFSPEFMERADGWPGLQRRYGLTHRATGLDHDLAYFPSYEALVLYCTALETTHPDVVLAFEALRDRVAETRMLERNAEVDVEGREEIAVASAFLEKELGRYVAAEAESAGARILRSTKEHLGLVGVSLWIAIVLGLGLGILAAKTDTIGQGRIGVVGAAQTIPGLALPTLLVPWLGIGWLPTVFALVVCSLLPIVRNTHAGITGIPRPIRESAEVLGLSARTRLLAIELPLAAPSILAGIKTAAVWNVGLATIGALIGGGGYGQSILLALLVQILFDVLERKVVSRGLRPVSS